MSIPKEMKAWILNERPTDAILPSTFRLDTVPAPQVDELKEGEYIVKTLAFGNDPAQRTWMDDSFDPKRMYHPPIMKGDQISSSVYGQVVASKAKSVKEGDHMVVGGKWAEYCKVAESPFNTPAKHIKGQSEYVSLGILGMTGLTAYVGAYGELDLKPEHTVVISGAAGAVGSTLVQIAKKIIGCKKVVGLAGGKQKCDWVKSLGADVCIDYKDKDYPKHLKDALPDFADSYFDNVGGEILNEMLGLLKRGGKIAACGAISGYNDKGFTLTKWGEVIFNRYTIHGFIFFDHPNLVVKGREDMAKWFDEGKLTNGEGETVVETKFEDIPKTYQKLFEGGNKGKLITKLV